MKYIFSVAFTFAGLFFVIVGVPSIYETYTVVNSPSEKTEGTVVDFINGTKGTLAPVFAYKTKNGLTLRYESHYYSAPPKYKKGDKIVLYYQIGKALNVHFDSFSENWALPLGIFFVGSLCLTAGVYTWIKTIQSVDNQEVEI